MAAQGARVTRTKGRVPNMTVKVVKSTGSKKAAGARNTHRTGTSTSKKLEHGTIRSTSAEDVRPSLPVKQDEKSDLSKGKLSNKSTARTNANASSKRTLPVNASASTKSLTEAASRKKASGRKQGTATGRPTVKKVSKQPTSKRVNSQYKAVARKIGGKPKKDVVKKKKLKRSGSTSSNQTLKSTKLNEADDGSSLSTSSSKRHANLNTQPSLVGKALAWLMQSKN